MWEEWESECVCVSVGGVGECVCECRRSIEEILKLFSGCLYVTLYTHTHTHTLTPSQVKRALPLLLSSMKAFVSLRKDKKKGDKEAQENRSALLLPPLLYLPFLSFPFSSPGGR